MNLFKWNLDVKPKFSNLVEKFFGKKITDGLSQNEDAATIPSVNISDENTVFDISIAVPGIQKKDIDIQIVNNNLIISSEKQYEKEDKHKNWLRKEYGYASFQRIFELPENADTEKIKAEMKNGILSISIFKDKDYISKSKIIEVQ